MKKDSLGNVHAYVLKLMAKRKIPWPLVNETRLLDVGRQLEAVGFANEVRVWPYSRWVITDAGRAYVESLD